MLAESNLCNLRIWIYIVFAIFLSLDSSTLKDDTSCIIEKYGFFYPENKISHPGQKMNDDPNRSLEKLHFLYDQ